MWLVLAVLSACGPERPPAPRLPIACEVGVDCWISNRPDRDGGSGIRDHTGGSSPYDGHSGTDLDVRHAGEAMGTWVVAPADGVVLRARDGVPDGELLANGEQMVGDRECGNGAVIDAGRGWELKLCHLANGTVQVQPGENVTAGARLGRVGWSGDADHPHLHLTVRHDGRLVDPFDGAYVDDGSTATPGPLWATPLPSPADMDALVWGGFDAGPAPDEDSWPMDGPRAVVPESAPSLVLRVFLWRPMAGDVVRTEIWRPDGTVTRSDVTQPRDRPRQTWTIEKIWAEPERPLGLRTARIEWQRGSRKRVLWASTVLE